MTLTRTFIARLTLSLVAVILALLIGVSALRTLVVQEQPNTSLPSVAITVNYSGASTSELRDEVVRPIENALSGTEKLDHLDSTIQTGGATITASFALDSQLGIDLTNVQKALQQAQGQLPADLIAPTVRIADPSEPVVVSLGLTSRKYSQAALAELASDRLAPVLEQISGVSNVGVKGQVQAAINVVADPAKLAASGLTLTDVIDAVEPNNVRAAGGVVYGRTHETLVDVRGDVTTARSVANLPVHAQATPASNGGAAAAAVPGLPQAMGAPAQNATSVNGVASVGQGAATGSTATSTATTSATQTLSGSAAAQVSVDQSSALTPPTVTAPAAGDGGAMPDVTTQGGGEGTSILNGVGARGRWTVPSADVLVGDLGEVSLGSVPVRVYQHENGGIGVGLDVQKAASASEVSVADDVLAALPSLRKQFPGVSFSVDHVQATYTRHQLEGVERTLVEGIALTALVMLFFLASWRDAVVVMVAIPTSLGITLGVMRALGITLDSVSLLAMTLVIGILVDDSTVVIENATRHRDDGAIPIVAAFRGRSEIGTAALVITLVDVVVFLPIAFVGGAVGRQLSEFGIVVTVATLTSLFVSFTITPALAGRWSLASKWKPWYGIVAFGRAFDALRRRYVTSWLPAAMRRPLLVLATTAAACVLSLALVPWGIVGEEYLPEGHPGELFLQMVYPPGTPLEDVRRKMFAIERASIKAVGGDLQAEETTAGGLDAAFGGFVQEGNAGQIHFWLTDDHAHPARDFVEPLTRIAQRVAPHARQLIVKTVNPQAGGPAQPIDVLVSDARGSDPTTYATRITTALRKTPGTTSIINAGSNVAPQVAVVFDRVRAQALDVSVGEAATAVHAAMGGAVATQIVDQSGLVQIEVIYPRANRTSLDEILDLPVRAQNGSIVHLGDFASLRSEPASLLITREDRRDVIHVTASVAQGYALSNVINDFKSRMAALHLPSTVSAQPAAQGQQDLMQQTLVALGGSLIGSIVLVFLMIVALYDSVRTPFVTLFAIPPASIGALGALALTHRTLNLYSLIGLVLLTGIATKNGILLVDFADRLREEGVEMREAMLRAAEARFRPIVMTTSAMIAGMLPLALGLEAGAAQRASLAVAVIGGLSSSLVLTLVVVPVMYLRLAPKRLNRYGPRIKRALERVAGQHA